MQRLDPERRALLELSFVHRLGDEELASMLATDTARLRERRERVLRELGAGSEDERAELATALSEHAGGPGRALPEAPERDRAPRRRHLLPAAIGGAVLIALALALVLSRGDGEDRAEPSLDPAGERPKDGSGARSKPDPGPEPPGGAGAVKLEPIAGASGSASAEMVEARRGPRLRLTVGGLPRPSSGGYVVWLYESVSDARALTGSRRGSFTVDEPLPAGALRYRFLDISREPADGNRNHSGASVLRLALARIRRR